jgi:UDP-galactopyranose mutase
MYLIVGCGLSGATIAERIANVLNEKVIIIDKRDHIGGNCYDYIDKTTNIRINKYGAHLFHTNNKQVWDYVNKFSQWVRWEHKVLSNVDNKFVSIPVNITTVNELCGENLQNTEEMNIWLEKNQIKYDKIENSEQMAKSRIGEKLYDKLVKNYTYKQWNKYPEELNPSVLARIPIRNDFDTRYFSDKYQALPKFGYTEFIRKMITHENIISLVNTSYEDLKYNYPQYMKDIEYTIFTGPIDEYFKDSGLEKLEYRSIDFNQYIYRDTNFFQPNSVVNYPNTEDFTRIVEYKHFLNQKSKDTLIVTEKTKDIGEPYYPVPNKKNLDLYEKYKQLAINEEKNNIYFLGRLANYKYFNMDAAIENALNFFNTKLIINRANN